MKTIAQVIEGKTAPIATVEAGSTVLDALKELAIHNIGAVLVTDAGSLVGIFSERDYARKLVLMARSPRDTVLGEIMSSPVMYVRPDQTSDECMALMTQNRMRHLPVMDGGQLIGLISIGDLVKATISEQQFIIEQLEHYITGQRG